MHGVEQTALATAYLRELESARADRLFTDPWAGHLVTASGIERPDPDTTSAARGGPAGACWTTIRTRFIDDALTAAAERCRQVVLLGAGLDTRALRLDWPTGTTVFEIDSESVHHFKTQAIAAAPVVPGDHPARRQVLTGDVADGITNLLTTVGHDPHEPTAWVAEGLMLYLSEQQCDALITEITALSPARSHLILTLTTPGHESRDPTHNPYLASYGPARPAEWLSRHEWTGDPVHPGKAALAYGRQPNPELDPDQPPTRHLVDATRG